MSKRYAKKRGAGFEPVASDNDYYVYPIRIKYNDIEVLEDFKKFVIEKHGKLHGFLGKEIINALSFYIEHTSRNERIFTSRHQQTKLIKFAKLLKLYKEISLTELKKIISQNFGSDERTIRKYINLAMMHDFIKVKIDKGFGKKIYEVNQKHISIFLGEHHNSNNTQVTMKERIKKIKKQTQKTEQFFDDELSELKLMLSAKPVE